MSVTESLLIARGVRETPQRLGLTQENFDITTI